MFYFRFHNFSVILFSWWKNQRMQRSIPQSQTQQLKETLNHNQNKQRGELSILEENFVLRYYVKTILLFLFYSVIVIYSSNRITMKHYLFIQ